MAGRPPATPPGDDAAFAYVAAVEARYVALRGQGFALSPADLHRVTQWHAMGVPLDLALRVLAAGVRDFRRSERRGGAPRTLAYFGKALKEAMAARAARQLGAGDQPSTAQEPGSTDAGQRSGLGDGLRSALAAAGKLQADERVRAVLRGVWRHVAAAEARGEDLWSLTATLDVAMVDELETFLSETQRDRIAAAAMASVDGPNMARMSPQSRREHERQERARRVRAALGVPELMEVLLDHDEHEVS